MTCSTAHRSTYGQVRIPLETRFWAKVDRRSDSECWVWTGANIKGYGYLAGTRREKPQYAHRLSYEMHKGTIPAGLCVCHTCDNPPCVNPAHLWLGTKSENSLDCIAKRRTSDRRGAKNPNVKLTAEAVQLIRQLRNGGMSQLAIAARVGVSQFQVSRIVRNLSWVEV